MTTRQGRNGFTLVEVLVASVAAAIVAMVVGLLLIMPIRIQQRNNDYARLRRDISYAERRLAKDIRETPGAGYVTYSTNMLTLLPTDLRTEAITYQRAGQGMLVRQVGDAAPETIIPEGVVAFDVNFVEDPDLDVQGVSYALELAGEDAGINLRHQTFVHTRRLL